MTTHEHKHHWRAYGQQDGTVVCDDCDCADDVNQLINQAIIEELDEALLSVNYFSRQKNLNDKEVMLSVTRYLRGRIKTFKEEL